MAQCVDHWQGSSVFMDKDLTDSAKNLKAFHKMAFKDISSIECTIWFKFRLY